jgi:hypothetical protein
MFIVAVGLLTCTQKLPVLVVLNPAIAPSDELTSSNCRVGWGISAYPYIPTVRIINIIGVSDAILPWLSLNKSGRQEENNKKTGHSYPEGSHDADTTEGLSG